MTEKLHLEEGGYPIRIHGYIDNSYIRRTSIYVYKRKANRQVGDNHRII